ncbi:MAG: hypothetical protein ACK55Z_04770 [bacterium]
MEWQEEWRPCLESSDEYFIQVELFVLLWARVFPRSQKTLSFLCFYFYFPVYHNEWVCCRLKYASEEEIENLLFRLYCTDGLEIAALGTLSIF